MIDALNKLITNVILPILPIIILFFVITLIENKNGKRDNKS